MSLRQYLITVERIGAGFSVPKKGQEKPRKLKAVKPIAIVDYSQFEPFLRDLQADSEVLLRVKALIAVCISGGLRISEALALQRSAINLDTNEFTIKVLKKRRPTTRHGLFMPIADQIIKDYLTKYPKKNFEYIFPFTRQSAYSWITELFGDGSCCHMFRHSHISYLLHEKHLDATAVESIMKVEPKVVKLYNHCNTTKVLFNMWGKK